MQFSSVEEILDDVRRGKPIVLVDDRDREDEGDLVVAAEFATPEVLSFMMREGKGLICLSITEQLRARLQLPTQSSDNKSKFGTNFTVSFDHNSVVAEGVTAQSRALTVSRAIAPDASAEEFSRPGFIFPVCAVAGGVLRRRGQTEGSVDLAKLAGLGAAGVICEIMDESGLMLRGESLFEYCKTHGFKICSIEDIVQYRLSREVPLRRISEVSLENFSGLGIAEQTKTFFESHPSLSLRVLVYLDDVENREHLAIVVGDVASDDVYVRLHSECLTGDLFESQRCDCGFQLDRAFSLIAEQGGGVILYLRQEGRGIGLANKLRAYELQDKGLDTVDANVALGFDPDERDYRVASHMLSDLGVNSVKLLTNNPEKINSLTRYGVTVNSRVELFAEPGTYNREYMLTKKHKMGHLLD